MDNAQIAANVSLGSDLCSAAALLIGRAAGEGQAGFAASDFIKAAGSSVSKYVLAQPGKGSPVPDTAQGASPTDKESTRSPEGFFSKYSKYLIYGGIAIVGIIVIGIMRPWKYIK